jgi:hypothetical protein
MDWQLDIEATVEATNPEWAEDHDVAQMSSVSMHPRGWWMRGTQ